MVNGGQMTITRITMIGAVVAVSAFAAKALAIWIAGGLGKSPIEDTLFFVGFVALVVGLASLGWTLAGRRPIAVRVLASVATVVAAIASSTIVGTVVSALASSDSWAWGEVQLWFPAVVLLLIVVVRARKRVDAAA